MLNDYIMLTKSYLKNYASYQQELQSIDRGILERKIELQSEPIKIATYGHTTREGSGELNSTEHAATNRLRLRQEIQVLECDKSILSGHIERMKEAVSTLSEEATELVKMIYIEQRSYKVASEKLHCSERWCKERTNRAIRDIAVCLFGEKVKNNIIFV